MKKLHRDVGLGGSGIFREAARAKGESAPRAAGAREGIAIVGMSCLLPGASGLDRFWQNVLAKAEAIREVPLERWDWHPYYAESRDTRDRVSSRWGGFLDPILFNPVDYGMPPSSVSDVEPLQLVMLEVARAALRDAGYGDENLPRERTAVVLGAGGGFGERGHDFAMRAALAGRFAGSRPEEIVNRLPDWNEDTFAGILMSMLAGRVASRLNLGGANFTVDAACAGSLAAVYVACRELESGAADVVITGGADFCQNPFYYFCFDKTHALSPSGHCRAFDRSADGTTLGEGVVALILKRREDAERDGDRIYAAIRGIGASSDGRGTGLTAPHVKGQVLALERAYEQAGISAAALGLVEGHGTGTVAGDRCEVRALKRVLDAAGAAPSSVALGSVKSMIGHTKSAAGAAGLVRAALALHHRVLPATLGVEDPNPSVSGGPLYVNTETRPWLAGKVGSPRLAAVSAFGFGGTNYHAVLEEVPACTPAAAARLWPRELFLWRAATMAQTIEEAMRVCEALKAGAQPSLRDLSFSLWRRAPAEGDATLAIVAESLDELATKIESARAKLANSAAVLRDPAGCYAETIPSGRRGAVAFLFPGQGSQYPDMLRELAVHFHEVREAFEAADRVLTGRLDRPLSSFVFPPPRFGEEEERAARQALTATNVAQPALGAAAVGLLELLRNLGVTPDMAAGHSYGEYAALCAAGCLTPEQLFALSEARGRFILEAAQGDLGRMAAVAADEGKTRALVGDLPDLWVANLNSPRQTIVSGTQPAVSEALKRLEAQGVAAQVLPVACAFHSPLVAPAKERLQQFLEGLSFHAPELRVFSNTTGAEYPAEPSAIRKLLSAHLVSPVRFVPEIEAMYEAGARVFIEVGPRSVLTGLTEQILAGRNAVALPMESRDRPGLTQLLHVMARLAAQGVRVNLERLYAGRNPREVHLDRLLQETQEAAAPATAWWVAGGRVTPVHSTQGAVAASAPSVVSGSRVEEPSAAPPAPSPVPEQSAVSLSHGGTDDALAILRTHARVMQRLLDTHRRVMLAALGTGEALPTGPAPAGMAMPVARAKSDVASPAEPETAAPAPTAAPPLPESDADRVRREVLRIVGERTGYPPDMLDVDADLEADLGIDSIKRVEIAGRLRKAFPHLGPTPESSAAGNLASLRSLRALIDRIATVTAAGGSAASKPAVPATTPTDAARPAAASASAGDVHVPRFMLRSEDAPAPDAPAELPRDAAFLITDDGRGAAVSVAAQIRARGGRAVLLSAAPLSGSGGADLYEADFTKPESLLMVVQAVRKAEGRVAGIVHLLPLGLERAAQEMDLATWRHALQQQVKSLFYLAQAAAADFRASDAEHRVRILAAIDARHAFPGQGGIAGLVNALATEWPGVIGRTLALNGDDPLPILTRRIMDELSCDDGTRFVDFHEKRRQRIRIEPVELDPRAEERVRIAPDWVILLTGGARGITGQVALELAERFKPTLVLTGRSPLPEAGESPDTRGVESPAELRRLLAGQLSAAGGKAALSEIEVAYRRLCREREMRDTLAALRATGARVTYLQADARDGRAFGEAIDRVYAEFGRLDGVVHGAGVIEDRRVEEKTPESFDRVFDTKADGAFVLAQRLRLDSVKFVVFFSSVSYLGAAGQSDYAAANGVMNALARHLDRRTPGRVVSVLWGPWGGAGMASEEVQRRLRERGLQIIPPPAGRRRLVEELQYGRKGDVEVLLGGGPYASAAATPDVRRVSLPLIGGGESVIHSNGTIEVSCVLDPSRHAYLRDHVLDGKPVFPAAMAMELMAESAWAATTEARGRIEIASLQIQQGIVLGDGATALLVSGSRAGSSASGVNASAFSMRIRTPKAPGRAHYRAEVLLGGASERPCFDPPALRGLDPFPLSVSEAYEQWLFQGRCFAAIAAIEGIRDDAIVGVLQSVAPSVCLPAAPDSQWLIDPTVVDASLQLVILWERHWHDMTPLPVHIGRFRLFTSLSGQPVRCLVKAAASDAGASLAADIYYTDAQGRLLAVLEGLQCACTKSLNRLSGSAARRTAATHGMVRRQEATR